MFIAAHEWSQPLPEASFSAASPALKTSPDQANGGLAAFYHRLAGNRPGKVLRLEAAEFLHAQIDELSGTCDLPESPHDLKAWMCDSAQLVTARYGAYLDGRKAGAPRRFFSNRAHALYFLRAVAPTKLVDGAWLHGLVAHWRNPRFADLVRTYLEELGEGVADKNHVLIYRQLLTRYGLNPAEELEGRMYVQGLVQLALGCNAEQFLPELIGFNLGYEQLPLHLLITAYELNELDIDPYYFTLHVTVDNADTGHAHRAVQAVLDNLPRFGDPAEFWRRVRVGYQLGNAGVATGEVIEDFDIEQEVLNIFARKSLAGQGAHSNYCRIAGRNVNDWLARPDSLPAFLAALQNTGWIKRGLPAGESRFWSLLQGPRAEMFGVFSPYELQVIHDWIRAEASVDGQPYDEPAIAGTSALRPRFRAAARLAAARGENGLVGNQEGELLDSDLQAFDRQLARLEGADQAAWLTQAIAPSQHWTPVGLRATRLFCQRMREPGV